MMENSEENVSGLITYDILKPLLWKKNSKTLIYPRFWMDYVFCSPLTSFMWFLCAVSTIDSKQNIAEFKISSLKPQSCSFHVNSTVYFKLTVICCYCCRRILHHTIPLALASLHCTLALNVNLSKYLTQIENKNLCHVHYFSSFQRMLYQGARSILLFDKYTYLP